MRMFEYDTQKLSSLFMICP